jgi:type II secretory pathway component PulM
MRTRRGWGREGLAKILTGLAIALLAAVAFDLRVRPVVEREIEYQAQRYGFQLVNQATLSALEGEQIPYDEIVSLSRGADGAVTSVETDMRAINLLKSRTADAISQRLEQRERQTILVSVGSPNGTL